MNDIGERYIKQIDGLLADLKKLSLTRAYFDRLASSLVDDDNELHKYISWGIPSQLVQPSTTFQDNQADF